MTDREGIANFILNIKPIMEKCRDGKNLTKQEQSTIKEFYLEVIHYVANS